MATPNIWESQISLAALLPNASLAETIATMLADHQRFSSLGKTARPTVVKLYDLTTVSLPAMFSLVDGLAAGQLPLIR